MIILNLFRSKVLIRTFLIISSLIVLTWVTMLALMFVIAEGILPFLRYDEGLNPLMIGSLRVLVGTLILALWAYLFHKMTKVWLYRFLTKRQNSDST